MTDVDVKDRPSALRYIAVVDGDEVGHIDYRLEDDVVVMTHTEVDPDRQEQGVGSELVRQALEDVRSNGKKVKPVCAFVRSFIDEHDEYRGLVAGL